MDRIADLRKSYERDELDERASDDDPSRQFARWFDEAVASEMPEPNAMTLATVDAGGRPSTRVVLVKGWDEAGLVWYTNYSSRKGLELAAHPQAALQFHWVELERVVRIEGLVSKVEDELSDAYYRSRPLGSRISAWASPQSKVIADRDVLERATADAEATHGGDPPRPPFWGGYRLAPDRWEFWQGRRSRLHDRLQYAPNGAGGWRRERLAP